MVRHIQSKIAGKDDVDKREVLKGEPVPRIDIKRFREMGFLQEVNRIFFHPIGLALEVIINDETGEEKLGGVWDFLNDPEGIINDPLNTPEHRRKAETVKRLIESKTKVRRKKFGWVIQPIIEGEKS